MAEPAVFVDRDGTVIRETEYLADPAAVELLPGAVDGLRSFREAGYPIVVVTNQSGIARGFYGEAEYRAVEAEVERQLAEAGVNVLAAYHCPHHPDITGSCRCRKPAAGMFETAAAEHDLALADSIYIGDRLRDIEPGVAAGGTGVLVRTGYGQRESEGAPPGVRVVDDLAAAARAVLGAAGR
ncbi:MAG: HAD family hydrolase [Longimicrobiales bacterium]